MADLGVSAFRGKNRGSEAELGKFLALVEAGKVEKGAYLIVESLDRISREEVIDVLPVFTSLIKAGIVIVTLMDSRSLNRTSRPLRRTALPGNHPHRPSPLDPI